MTISGEVWEAQGSSALEAAFSDEVSVACRERRRQCVRRQNQPRYEHPNMNWYSTASSIPSSNFIFIQTTTLILKSNINASLSWH
jgi:hypothetical protein